MELIMKISILNKNYYPKQRVCTENGICGFCTIWKKGDCYGNFSRIITDDDLKKIIDKLGEIVKKKGYITKDELREIAKNYEIKLTDRLLNHYCKLGLIEHSIMKRLAGFPGTVSFWKEDTPKILYVIRSLKECGYKIKLNEMKYWLNLLKLSEGSIKEIRRIQEEDENFNENIEFKIGITPTQKKYLLKNYPLKLYDYKKLITRFDILKRVIKERAYSELDFTDLKIETSKDINELEESLDNPEIEINLEIPEIKVIYKEPISKEVILKKDGLIKVIDN